MEEDKDDWHQLVGDPDKLLFEKNILCFYGVVGKGQIRH